MEDKDYLGAYQEEYENANRESNFIKLSFAEAVRSAREKGIDVDPLLINKIDKFTSAAGTPVDVQQYAYNYYDESVEQELYTSEQVTKAAIENAAAYEKEAQDLKDVLVSFDRMGIAVGEEDRANIQAHIAQLKSLAKEAGYVALDGNDNFEEVAERRRKGAGYRLRQRDTKPGGACLRCGVRSCDRTRSGLRTRCTGKF